MVLPNYELFDFEASDRLAKSRRPDTYEPGGVLSEGQNELQLEDGVRRYRDALLGRMAETKDSRDYAQSEELNAQAEFLYQIVRYMGVIPGALTSVWGPTSWGDWRRIGKAVRFHSQLCEREVERTMAPLHAQGVSELTAYAGSIDRGGHLLHLVAVHFEESAARGEAEEEAAEADGSAPKS